MNIAIISLADPGPAGPGSPLLAEPQQAVVLLPLAQQQVATREPVGVPDTPGDVLLPCLVDVDPTLLDRTTRFALRLGEPRPHHRVDERQAVPRRHGRSGEFLRQDVEGRVVGGVRVEAAEQDLGRADDLRSRVRAVDALRDVAGEGALCLARRRVRLELGEHRVDLRARQEGEELQGALRVAVVRIEPELVELLDRFAGWIEPVVSASRLPAFYPLRGWEDR